MVGHDSRVNDSVFSVPLCFTKLITQRHREHGEIGCVHSEDKNVSQRPYQNKQPAVQEQVRHTEQT